MKKICHLTSVHNRYDTRIFIKECISLAKKGFSVFLIVADGKGNENNKGVNIFDVGVKNRRISRMLFSSSRIYAKAKKIDADIYHLHDPELIPIGLMLKKQGKKVIFDSHEDVPVQILTKTYLNPVLKFIISKIYKKFEYFSCKKFNVVITSTDFIRDKFLKINKNTHSIKNYPILDEVSKGEFSWVSSKNKVIYLGTIDLSRGIDEMISSLELVDTNINFKLGGRFETEKLRNEIIQKDGWSKVEELGWVKRDDLQKVFKDCFAGLVLLHPKENYLDSLPVKMFEYMGAGLPVICSDFRFWKKIIDEVKCGIYVDPLNKEEIANAINYLAKKPDEAMLMGKNGFYAVKEKYNWQYEEAKFFDVYNSLLKS